MFGAVRKGQKMNIKANIERVRTLAETLQNWDEIIKQKRSDAVYCRKFGFEDIKVNTNKISDRILKGIIDIEEAEGRKEKVFEKYCNEKKTMTQIIEKYAKVEDITILYRYLLGVDLSQIPLTGRQKNPAQAIAGAIKRLQAVVNAEEEINKQPTAIQNLIKGGKKKCKHCDEGFIYYKSEDLDKFIFVCDGCGKKYKAIKGV